MDITTLPVPLLAAGLAAVGALIGIILSAVAGWVNERTKWKRDQHVRFHADRIDAYVGLLTAIDELVNSDYNLAEAKKKLQDGDARGDIAKSTLDKVKAELKEDKIKLAELKEMSAKKTMTTIEANADALELDIAVKANELTKRTERRTKEANEAQMVFETIKEIAEQVTKQAYKQIDSLENTQKQVTLARHKVAILGSSSVRKAFIPLEERIMSENPNNLRSDIGILKEHVYEAIRKELKP
jgi:hypothetical protein